MGHWTGWHRSPSNAPTDLRNARHRYSLARTGSASAHAPTKQMLVKFAIGRRRNLIRRCGRWTARGDHSELTSYPETHRASNSRAVPCHSRISNALLTSDRIRTLAWSKYLTCPLQCKIRNPCSQQSRFCVNPQISEFYNNCGSCIKQYTWLRVFLDKVPQYSLANLNTTICKRSAIVFQGWGYDCLFHTACICIQRLI